MFTALRTFEKVKYLNQHLFSGTQLSGGGVLKDSKNLKRKK